MTTGPRSDLYIKPVNVASYWELFIWLRENRSQRRYTLREQLEAACGSVQSSLEEAHIGTWKPEFGCYGISAISLIRQFSNSQLCPAGSAVWCRTESAGTEMYSSLPERQSKGSIRLKIRTHVSPATVSHEAFGVIIRNSSAIPGKAYG